MTIKSVLLFGAALCSLANINPACAQGTAFTYQGRLVENGTPANGSYDFMCVLYNVLSNQVSITLTNPAVPVSNGLFITTLDFGEAFGGDPRWLNLWVRTNASGAFAALTPGQKFTAAPYAITAEKVTGLVSDEQITGPILRTGYNGSYTGQLIFSPSPTVPPFAVGNTNKVIDLNADMLDGLDSSAFWKTAGNSGTSPGTHFLGTTDNQSLELKVNGQRAFRLEPNSSGAPNVIGGFSNNFVSSGTTGATIAGGGQNGAVNRVTLNGGTVGGGYNNAVSNFSGTVSGGINNVAAGNASSISGGSENRAIGDHAALSGGQNNNSSGNYAWVGGGGQNTSSGDYAAVGGGAGNHSIGLAATVPGGANNSATGDYSFATGRRANANHQGSFVWADSQFVDFASTANNQFLIRAAGGVGMGLTAPQQQLSVASGMNIDQDDANSGTVGNTMRFGSGSGEAIGSKRTAGGNQWGLDFYTGSINRMSIANNGDVSIAGSSSLSFGSQTRQMLNLWDTKYGIGVQTSTVYFRTDNASGNENGFGWYKGGTHSNLAQNPGGGTIMMLLNGTGLTVNGTFVSASDRNTKENFTEIKPSEVLAKVAALPITSWNYKQDAVSRHLGPMAQDFYAAFGVGPDDKHITVVDESGVALAAIQGLNEKVEIGNRGAEIRIQDLEQSLEQKQTQITELKRRLETLEGIIRNQKSN